LLDLSENGAKIPAWVARYEHGLAAYRSRDFAAAASLFQGVLDERPSDQAARSKLERCGHYLDSPPGEDWEATHAMSSK